MGFTEWTMEEINRLNKEVTTLTNELYKVKLEMKQLAIESVERDSKLVKLINENIVIPGEKNER